jgi:dienelactone hydrolase
VDPERVGVWGMSMGGGHALITAAEDSRVAAVVALVPATDPLATRPPARVGLRMIGPAAREALTRAAKVFSPGAPNSESMCA